MNKNQSIAVFTGKFQVNVYDNVHVKRMFEKMVQEIFHRVLTGPILTEGHPVITFTVYRHDVSVGWNPRISPESEHIGLTMDETIEVLNSYRKPKHKVVNLGPKFTAIVNKYDVEIMGEKFPISAIHEILDAAESL